MPYDRHAWILITESAPPLNTRVLAVGPECGRMIVIFKSDGVYDPIGQDAYTKRAGKLDINPGYYAFTHWMPLLNPSDAQWIPAADGTYPPSAREVLAYEASAGHFIGARVVLFPQTPQQLIYWENRRGDRLDKITVLKWHTLPEEPEALGTTPPAPLTP